MARTSKYQTALDAEAAMLREGIEKCRARIATEQEYIARNEASLKIIEKIKAAADSDKDGAE